VSGNARLHLADACQCPVPAQFQLCRHQTIGGIGRVVLSEGAIGGIAHCFQVSDQGVADLVATRRFLRIGLDRCGNGAWFNNFQDRRFNGTSTRKPPKAMQRGSPLSSQPRLQLYRGISCFAPV
jgi:hypothetical protein